MKPKFAAPPLYTSSFILHLQLCSFIHVFRTIRPLVAMLNILIKPPATATK